MVKASTQSLLLVELAGISPLRDQLSKHYQLIFVPSLDLVEGQSGAELALILMDARGLSAADYLAGCRAIKALSAFQDTPVFLYLAENEALDMLEVYDAGFDDVITSANSVEQILARLNKAVFHAIASRQLKSRLQQANEMAFTAMSDTSDLGVNIQFLVHCHDCSNLDELGMLLFRALSHYQLSCSLQLRSEFEVKNLEPTGLAKDLEARLLWELKDAGRYVDFGHRCVMNYGRVSLLVKKMPDDPKRVGTVKDNVFSLLQGTDARIKSIDNGRMLEMERDVLGGMAHKMQSVMTQVDERYQEVMRRCAALVEDMAMRVDEAILFLDLTEAQEDTFTEIMQTGVHAVTKLFNEGLRIDESFRRLIDHLNMLLDTEHVSVDELRKVLERL